MAIKKRQGLEADEDWRLRGYGRITGGELESLLTSLREAWSTGKAVRDAILQPSAIKFWSRVAAAPHWGQLYSLTFNQVIALVIKLTGTEQVFFSGVESENPTQALLRDLPPALEQVDLPEDPLAIPVVLVLLANLDAISRFSLTIHDLLSRVKERQCVQSLSRAASVDTAVLALPHAQLLMRSLQMAGDYESLKEFLRAVAAGPHKGRAVYQELRWAEYVLREQGAFDQCSFAEVHELLVKHLKLYGDDDELEDSKKALAMVFRKWRREAGN